MTTATQCTNCGYVSNNHLPGEACLTCQAGKMEPITLKCDSPIPINKVIDPDTGAPLILLPLNNSYYTIKITVTHETFENENYPKTWKDPDLSHVIGQYLNDTIINHLSKAFHFEESSGNELDGFPTNDFEIQIGF